jgi:hypothetical protein
MSLKNSDDTIGNRTRDLSDCSAVPQPTATAFPLGSVTITNNAIYIYNKKHIERCTILLGSHILQEMT